MAEDYSGKVVLVVDDAEWLEAMASCIRDDFPGITVIACSAVGEAMREIGVLKRQGRVPDILLTDIRFNTVSKPEAISDVAMFHDDKWLGVDVEGAGHVEPGRQREKEMRTAPVAREQLGWQQSSGEGLSRGNLPALPLDHAVGQPVIDPRPHELGGKR